MGKEHGILTNQSMGKEYGILLSQDMVKEYGIFLNQNSGSRTSIYQYALQSVKIAVSTRCEPGCF